MIRHTRVSVVGLLFTLVSRLALADEPAVTVEPPSPDPSPVLGPSSEASSPTSPTPPAVSLAHETAAEASPVGTGIPLPAYGRFRFGTGWRIAYIPDNGFDPYAKNDVLGQWMFDASYTLFIRDKYALAVGASWDFGGRSGHFRGADSSILAHRLSAVVEGRWSPRRDLYAFARLAPGINAVHVTVDELSAPRSLSDTAWAFSTDVSVGASYSLASDNHSRRIARVWVTPEIGYGFAFAADVRPDPRRASKDQLGVDEPLNLGSLSLGGLFWRIGMGVTY